MKPFVTALLIGFALGGLSGCVAPVGPVEVTRFHVADTGLLGRGSIAVEPAPGMSGDGLEFRTYAAAVARQLKLVGYGEQPGGGSEQVASLRVERRVFRPSRNGGPVSVGVGIGLDLSGPPPEQAETMLAVTIRNRRTGQSLWEGRSSFTVRADSPLANTQLGAAKMAEALFQGFPGRSGETIQVR